MWNSGKSSISIFKDSFASADKIFFLGGRLGFKSEIVRQLVKQLVFGKTSKILIMTMVVDENEASKRNCIRGYSETLRYSMFLSFGHHNVQSI